MNHVLQQVSAKLMVGMTSADIAEYGVFAGCWVPDAAAIPAGEWVADADDSYCPCTWSEPNMPVPATARLSRKMPCLVVDGKLFVYVHCGHHASFVRFSKV